MLSEAGHLRPIRHPIVSLNPCCNGRCSLSIVGNGRNGNLISLNPCCNGRCSLRTQMVKFIPFLLSLNPCCNGRCSLRRVVEAFLQQSKAVLILVVMEDALWVEDWDWQNEKRIRLNPCCNGRCSLSRRKKAQDEEGAVLILVVMEDALWGPTDFGWPQSNN